MARLPMTEPTELSASPSTGSPSTASAAADSAAPGASSAPVFRVGAWSRLALALLPLVAATGLVLAGVYRPGEGWWSVAAIRGSDVSFVRDLHRWGGELLLLAAWLHVFRVFLVGAYRRLRGWTVSVSAALFVILWMATGWLLRGDAGAASAVDSLGLGVSFVYMLHVLGLPLALVAVVVVWRYATFPAEDAVTTEDAS